MKFDRIKLIARIDEIEADRRKAHDDAFAPRLAAWDKHMAQWKQDGGPKLAAILRDLAKKAAAGQPVTQDQIEKATGRYEKSRAFVGPKDLASRWAMTEKPSKTPYQPDRQMAALRALLTQATTDQYVTTSVLRELGFSPSQFIKAAV